MFSFEILGRFLPMIKLFIIGKETKQHKQQTIKIYFNFSFSFDHNNIGEILNIYLLLRVRQALQTAPTDPDESDHLSPPRFVRYGTLELGPWHLTVDFGTLSCIRLAASVSSRPSP